ncbi:PLD nuclease N-terminal domain-containing protein [Paucilactobacillus sp. N302-9]
MHKHCRTHRFPKKLLPMVIFGLFIQIFALVDILKSNVFLRGNKGLWIALVFVMPPFGALSYYVFGREAF